MPRTVRGMLCAGLVACCALTSHAQTTQTTSAITADDLRHRVFLFAHDSMLGRMTGTRGHVRATEYLVRELTRIHAKPAGDKDTYYQNVPIDRVRVNVRTAELSTSGVMLKPGIDFLPIVGHFGVPFPASSAADRRRNVLQFGGSLSDTVSTRFLMQHRSDSSMRLGGDSAIFVLQPPVRAGGLPDYQIWNAAEMVEQYRGVSAVFVESLDLTPRSVLATLAATGFMLHPEKDNLLLYTNAATGEKSQRTLPPLPPVIAITPSASGMLRVAPGGFANLRFTSTIGFVNAATRNVVAMVEGSGSLKGELVVLSAHADHLGIAGDAEREGADSIMNGADVSGSGSMALLEIAEYIAALPDRPRRTIVFLWTVGEEQGMLGSQWFVAHTTAWLGTVVANINVDAIGRGSATDIPRGGPDYVQILGANVLSTEYARWIESVIRRPDTGLAAADTIDGAHLATGASCVGDHWSFARAGIPSVFVTTGPHADTRAVTDGPQALDYEKAAKVTRFVAALALDVANRPTRPALDTPKLGPLAPCGR